MQNIHISSYRAVCSVVLTFPVKPVRPEFIIKPVGLKRAIFTLFLTKLLLGEVSVDMACPTVQTPFLHLQAW